MSIYWPAQTPDSRRRAAAALGALGATKPQNDAVEIGVRTLAQMSGANIDVLRKYANDYAYVWDNVSGDFGTDIKDMNGSSTGAGIKKNALELIIRLKQISSFSVLQKLGVTAAAGAAAALVPGGVFVVRSIKDVFANSFDSDAAPKGLASALIGMREYLRDNGGNSMSDPVARLFGAVRVVYLVIPAMTAILQRTPTDGEIDSIARQTKLKNFDQIKSAVAAIAGDLETARKGILDESAKAMRIAENVQREADAIRKSVNEVLSKLGLPVTAPRGSSSGNKVAAVRPGMNVPGNMTVMKLAGLGLIVDKMGVVSSKASMKKGGGFQLPQKPATRGKAPAFVVDKSRAPAKDSGSLLSSMDAKTAAALADEAAGNAQAVADKARAAAASIASMADVVAAKQATAIADAALIEIKTHRNAANAAVSQANRAYAAEQKVLAETKAAQVAAQAAADKAAADKAAGERRAFLETQRSYFMTLDKKGLIAEYEKVKVSQDFDLINVLLDVARTRVLDLLKKAAPFAAILGAGAIGIFLFMRARKA